MRNTTVFAIAMVGVLMACSGLAWAEVIEDFDAVGSTPFTLTNTSGVPGPAVTAGTGTNNFLRLTNLTGSNNNSIAFDEEPSASGPAPAGFQLAFDFRMSDDAANAAAGGCCGSAADGLGIGLFATAAYGTTGGINPSFADPALGPVWERPIFPYAFAVGLDIFQNIDVVSLNFDGVEVATADVQPFTDLNNNVWNRALVNVKPDGANALVDMIILEDVDGFTKVHSVFTDQSIPGMDLAALPSSRLIAGGRTGGAFAAGDLDNIALTKVPEPGTIALLLAGLIGLAVYGWRRR